MIVKEELDGIGIDDFRNLDDLLRIVLIHEECGNLKVFIDGGVHTRNINKQKNPGILYAYKCPLLGKCYRRDYSFNTNMEYCQSVR